MTWYVLHSNPDGLLDKLWQHHRDHAWARFALLLEHEAKLDNSAYVMTWQRFATTEVLPKDLLENVAEYLIAKGLPQHERACIHALRIALQHNHADFSSFLESIVARDWKSAPNPAPWSEKTALVIFATWWLLEPKAAEDVVEKFVLRGSRHKECAIGFINAILDLEGHSGLGFTWSSNIPLETYAALLPLLYVEFPQRTQPNRSCQVTPYDEFISARDRLVTQLVTHIASGPVQIVGPWFAQWKQEARFGNHQDWFANIHAEISQRRADESWKPLQPQQLAAILDSRASLIRSDTDLFIFLQEVIENKLVLIFRSDYSLSPLLWTGTKSGGRSPVLEKTLQIALYNQLMMLLKGLSIIGAREPEVFDQKKPDNRVSYALDDGSVIHIPIEIKWASHDTVWDAFKSQLVDKYMLDPRVRYGIYLVAWAGPTHRPKAGPNGENPTGPIEFRDQLRCLSTQGLQSSGKSVSIHVVDVSVP